MSFSKTTIQSLDDKDASQETESGKKSTPSGGPPAAVPKPRQAADTSLYSTAGKAAGQESASGLGAEGGSTAMMGMQGMALVQRGLQMLNLAFPDNPGLLAVLADLTGRLQSIIPQLISQQSNGMGMGLFPQPQAPMPGAGGPIGPPMPPQAPMQAPPMGGAPPMQAGAGGPPPMPPR